MTDEPKPKPSDEELRAAIEEQMKRITVKDVLLQTTITLMNVAARKLGLTGDEEQKDLEEARRGIEGVRTLLPLLPAEEQAAVREPLSQLQLTYAREAGAGGQRESPAASQQSAEDAERAKARSKIWTPPGT